MTEFSLGDLERIISERVASTAEASYTKSLLDAGIARVAKKFGEEAIEATIAAFEADNKALIAEAADVLYHLLVLLRARQTPLNEVMQELSRRTSMSGHAEKEMRGT